jgi:hypothetical protein
MGFSFTLAGASSRSTSTTRLAGRNVGFCECDEAPPGGGGGSGSGSGSGSGNGDGTIL